MSPDPAAAVYPYRQRFQRSGADGLAERWACITRVRLAPFDAGPVKPHERTYPDTVGERSRLRELVGADLGLILIVYDDPTGELDRLVAGASGQDALFEAEDESGTGNGLWRWDDAEKVTALQEGLAAANGFIADGHHRYTAALAHWQGRGGRPEDAAGWVMAALVSASSPGLRVLPTHRLTARAPTDGEIDAWRDSGLDVTSLGGATTPSEIALAASRALEEHADDHVVVMVRGRRGELDARLVRGVRGRLDGAAWPEEVPESWKRLDVPVLHSLMLDPWMADVLRDQTEDHGALDYCNDVLESVEAVASGAQGAAFIINPLSVGEVQGVVAAGDVLPPKSTNFFPKVIAGLTIHAFDDPAVS